MLKVELHAHTSDDPSDAIPHTTRQLIDHAAALGYHALAITCHNRYYDPALDAAYAAARGITLIAGVEKTIDRAHILLINFPASSNLVSTYADIARLKATHSKGLVIAPHAFYPTVSAIGAERLEREAAVFDAIEISAMYTGWVDFNAPAVAWAKRHRKPLVGNSDLHVLAQMGTTYTLVDAAPDADAICDAIRNGRVEVRTAPLSSIRSAWLFGRMLLTGAGGILRRLKGRQPGREE